MRVGKRIPHDGRPGVVEVDTGGVVRPGFPPVRSARPPETNHGTSDTLQHVLIPGDRGGDKGRRDAGGVGWEGTHGNVAEYVTQQVVTISRDILDEEVTRLGQTGARTEERGSMVGGGGGVGWRGKNGPWD